MDVTTWVAGITSLAGMAKAWVDLKKSGTDLAKVRLEITKLEAQPQRAPDQSEIEGLRKTVIDQELLSTLVEDILSAKRRFYGCINDDRYTPADVDKEEARARRCVCTHLTKVRQFNAGALPSTELESLEVSFRCNDA